MSALSVSVGQLQTNARQWEAFTTEGHCVVLAPPGSGKTQLLTTRLAFDVANKIKKPQGAACITLTNAAADELRRRVELLGVEDRPTLFVGTVHSFALRKIIEPYATMIGRPELANITIASKQQCDKAYEEAIDEAFPYGADIWNVRSTIKINRERLASAEDWARHSDEVQLAAKLYEAKLRDQGLYDFLDVVATAVELVERHRSIRQVLTAAYPHIYVDEYQDLPPGLDRLVKALCFDHLSNSELFAVGDPEQAVYAFNGAKPELLLQLARQPDVATVELEHNYRCGQELIRIANLMRRGKAPITGHREGGQASATYCPGGMEDQYRHVVQHVRDGARRGVSLHEIAVLCPLREQCRRAAELLRANGIPAFFRDTEETYRLGLVTGFIEGVAAWAALGRERSHYRLGDLLWRWRTIRGSRWTQDDDVALVELLMAYQDRTQEPATSFVSDLLALDLASALDRVALADDALEVRRMQAALTTGDLRNASVRELAERARKVDRVEVTTTVSSKGLEFDIVLLVGADEESIPSWLSKTTSQLDEERRKFYVSITRARNELRIFYSRWVLTKRNNRRDVQPSRYLREIGLI
ncbi:ATP-dependent helicase [Saccharothrix sp. NPDC042600]|uniref:ATP-dependent helicase n=1 Tax=Saccharothrix TaxID=2071 RepID=UPI0033DD930A|nr:hypothetical protein GCM10017745_35440 [Saccharothrix mutabilis subsp. capreolus]